MTRELLDPVRQRPRGARRQPPSGRVAPPRLALAAGLVAVLLAIRALSPADLDLGDALQDFLTLSISVVVESLPFVFLGVLLSVAVQVWVPQHVLFRVLPKGPIARRAVLSVLGVLLPVCECGNVPLARGLVARGLTVPDAMTFLLAAPILNPITIITTYQAFGFADGILFWRIVGGFVIANGVGWLFSRHAQPDQLLTPRFAEACAVHAHEEARRGRGVRSLRMYAAETGAMLPALFVGAGIAGFVQVAVQRDLLIALGQNPVLSVLALMALAFVISICSNVDAFFVLSLGSTFSPGAVIAFLVFGPMIDIKMIALLRTTFTVRTLVTITTVVALAVAVLGLAVNLAG